MSGTYNYEKNVEKDLRSYLKKNFTLEDIIENQQDIADQYTEFNEVHGKDDRSYTLDSDLAKEYIAGNESLIEDTINSMEIGVSEIANFAGDPEYWDSQVRLYILLTIIDGVLSDIVSNGF